MYDIVIVGGGPAGAVLASRLKGHSVLLIDKKTKDGGFQKPCGGLLAPDAQKALAELGLNLPKDVLVDPQIFSVLTLDADSGITKSYQRMYINLDRHKFDMWLLSQISTAVERVTGTVTGIAKAGDGYEVIYNEGQEQKRAKCKILVGADGAKSPVRKFVSQKFKTRTYMSVQQWFEDANPTPFYSCVFDSKITNCYSWSVSKDGKFIFGGAYPVKNARALFEAQKQKLENAGVKFGTPLKTEACLVLRPIGLKSFCRGKENAFLIGEAAGFISPSSLEGISSAIISAVKLADVLNSGKGIRAYKRKTGLLCLKLALKNLKCPFMYNTLLRRLVMKSGIKTIRVNNGQNL